MPEESTKLLQRVDGLARAALSLVLMSLVFIACAGKSHDAGARSTTTVAPTAATPSSDGSSVGSSSGANLLGLWKGYCPLFTSLEFLAGGTLLQDGSQRGSYSVIDNERVSFVNATFADAVFRYALSQEELRLFSPVLFSADNPSLFCRMLHPGGSGPLSSSQETLIGQWAGSSICEDLGHRDFKTISFLDGNAFETHGSFAEYEFLDDHTIRLGASELEISTLEFSVSGSRLTLRDPSKDPSLSPGSCEFTPT